MGLRDWGMDLSGNTEVIAIEAKLSTARFAASAGQARGYSVFADRVYLAISGEENPFTPEHHLVASALDIGLLWVSPRGRPRVREILTSPIHRPVDEFRLQLLDRIDHGQCTICGSIFATGDNGKRWTKVQRADRRNYLTKAARSQAGLVYWLSEVDRRRNSRRNLMYHRRYVCGDCLMTLLPADGPME